jgi:hypothetical protein
MKRAVLILLLTGFGLAVALVLSGCATGPTPFETGAEAPPPMGCIQGRARGVDC